MNREEQQFVKMTQTPVKRLIISLGIPTIISMLVTAIYNLADTFFVSNIGIGDERTYASGAVGVVFSLMAIVQAIGFMFGMGAGSLISSKLGEKKDEEAQVVASSAFYIAIALGIILSIICIIFMDSIMGLLGATDKVLPYARSYALYIVFGFPVMVASFIMNNLLRAEGKSKLAMIGLTTGGVLNIGLDPLFIYVFKMGISGAAIATLISQVISALILLSMFIFKKSIIKLSIFKITKQFSIYLEIIKIGLPSLCRQGLASIATILLNRQAGLYGDEAALSAMGIVSKIFMVIFSMCLGIGQGYQPVCGYNYFAKKYYRVKEAMYFTFIFSLIFMTLFCLFFFIFAESVIKWFIDDDLKVIEIGKATLRYQCIALPFLTLNVITNMTFQSTKQKFKASLLSSCRQGIFFIPVILILPLLNGIQGVEMTQAIADFLTFLFTIPFFIGFVKKLNEQINQEIMRNEI